MEYTLMKSKTQYSLEPYERELAFEIKKGEGWEEEYKGYRKKWHYNPKNRIIEEYPLNIDIALTNFCNLKCPMCYTVSDEFNNLYPKSVMAFDLFKKIIDEVAGHVPAVRFVSYGEQTLHPNFIEFLKYAKDKKVKEVSLVTNGSKLDKAFITGLIDAGLDWLIISIDGMHDTYESIRKPIKFNSIVESLRLIKAIKEERNTSKPLLQVQSIWSAVCSNYEEYYRFFKYYADIIHFNPTFDYNKVDNMIYENECCCPQLFQRLDIGVDGKAYPCCAWDYSSVPIGDVCNETIKEIWQGERINAIRSEHMAFRGFETVPMCRGCIEGARMEREGIYRIEEEKREFEVYKYMYK